MSADDAIFVQKNKDDRWVAQWGSMSADDPPDPKKAIESFLTLEEAVSENFAMAAETEYGFRFPTIHNFGFRVGTTQKECPHGCAAVRQEA